MTYIKKCGDRNTALARSVIINQTVVKPICERQTSILSPISTLKDEQCRPCPLPNNKNTSITASISMLKDKKYMFKGLLNTLKRSQSNRQGHAKSNLQWQRSSCTQRLWKQ